MSTLCLVTGANGHLGNTLVRALLRQGYRVRAGVRDVRNLAPFAGLDCEVVYAEALDEVAMFKAMQGVEVLFQVAAVFKHWARDPQREIITPNVQGTRCVLAAAARAGVERVVHVSSVAAVGHAGEALDETQWNSDTRNAYYTSKLLAERAAWETAQVLGLWMVSVLPSAIIGPNAARLTDTMGFLQALRLCQMPFDPGFHFNFVDVRDVADGLIRAALVGQPGQRYLLANSHCSSLGDVLGALNAVSPGYRLPPPAPRWLLLCAAWLQERRAQLTGQPAQLLVSQVRMFHKVRQQYSTLKARGELGFNPRSPQVALAEAFAYLQRQPRQPYEDMASVVRTVHSSPA
ncbi:NAD-dependent epimerase/dehydratase family protein [Pseudomonas aegrilactucae]|uniref:NAD-dependent epimerase/dehydratase family protein n=1 Tax=Pseudomonas aegrilactucae TaxID=2854028 RepID=A0A9Q2XKC1_9PSED|nr:NAD-dependent epimerase/dehydratase family protein [Pseudomonas aegrilactucae]MBV6287874.1 NAD-dependent epimerase/dehydratase family protein [Pseudomonas aegrilactucae]